MDPDIVKAWQNTAAKMKRDETFQKISQEWSSIKLKRMGIAADIENGVLSL